MNNAQARGCHKEPFRDEFGFCRIALMGHPDCVTEDGKCRVRDVDKAYDEAFDAKCVRLGVSLGKMKGSE